MLFVKKFLSVIFILCGLFSTVFADTAASDALTALLKNMRSMQSDFTQNILDKNGKSIQKGFGRMSLQRPNQFRWEVLKSNRQLIVTNGKRLWIYDPDLEQVTIRALVKAAGETPAMLLSDEDLSLSKDFTVKQIHNNNSNLQWFYLIPKDQGSMIASLKLAFNQQIISEMQLEDHLGHITKIEFSHIKINSSLSPALFNFKPPAHIDIIDETSNKKP